jgi:hypothetical protein
MPHGKDFAVTSLFGSFAIKQSFGASHFRGHLATERLATLSVSQAPERRNATISANRTLTERPLTEQASVEEQLFDAAAAAKIITSHVAMHMHTDWRKRLYRQLDSLLDTEEWMEGDAPLSKESFETFLRLMLLMKPKVRPGLGLTPSGQLIATWQAGESRLTVECHPNDLIRWVISHPIRDQRESGAGETTIDRLPDVLAPYAPVQLLGTD